MRRSGGIVNVDEDEFVFIFKKNENIIMFRRIDRKTRKEVKERKEEISYNFVGRLFGWMVGS